MVDRQVSLAERMAQAARQLQDNDDPQTTMEVAVRLAMDNVRGCDAAGLSLVRRRRDVETPAYTAEVVAACDRLQNELQEGPCLDAIWQERTIHSPDLREDDRWPHWGPRVVDEFGVRSVLCFRLFTHEDTVGGLNLYSRAAEGFDDVDRDDGLALAAHIAVGVAAAQKIEQLSHGMDSRTLIGQAIGIVMERYNVDAERAFQVLSRLSSHSNRKLVSIAEELVATRRLPSPPVEAQSGGSGDPGT